MNLGRISLPLCLAPRERGLCLEEGLSRVDGGDYKICTLKIAAPRPQSVHNGEHSLQASSCSVVW